MNQWYPLRKPKRCWPQMQPVVYLLVNEAVSAVLTCDVDRKPALLLFKFYLWKISSPSKKYSENHNRLFKCNKCIFSLFFYEVNSFLLSVFTFSSLEATIKAKVSESHFSPSLICLEALLSPWQWCPSVL